jgi:xylulokinase
MDARGAPYVRAITGGPVRVEGYSLFKLIKWLRITGGIPLKSGKDPIAHILFIKNEYPDIYRRTCKFLEPKDYLNLRLTGRFYASTESIALHWVTDNRDIDNIDYHDGLIKMSGIDREKLPELKNAVDVAGPLTKEAAGDLGLSPGISVIMGTPDLHSAALGSGAVADYEGHLYIGTSSWLLCHMPYRKTDIFHNMGTLPSAIPGKYLLINEQETAGEALNFLKDSVFFPDDGITPPCDKDVHEEFNRLAASVEPGSGKLVFTPWLNGERTPVEDHLVRGGFHNMSLSTTRAHMVRAVMEGVAMNSRWLLTHIEKLTKQTMSHINIIGGGAQSDLWCQIHADVLKRTIRRVKDPILANMRGAGFLGAVAMGRLSFEKIPEKIEIDATFIPESSHKVIYDGLFKAFLEIYKKNNSIYRRLNRF